MLLRSGIAISEPDNLIALLREFELIANMLALFWRLGRTFTVFSNASGSFNSGSGQGDDVFIFYLSVIYCLKTKVVSNPNADNVFA